MRHWSRGRRLTRQAPSAIALTMPPPPSPPPCRALAARWPTPSVQDIRATEKDKVQVYRSFRPGDVVLADVISLGDARSYYLSTARNELGVIFAESEAGETMVPVSWQEMMCPKTKTKEFRKVAKPATLA